MHSVNMLLLSVMCCFHISSRLVDGTLFFPGSSAYGIFAAIAVPLNLPHRNCFISYNFEANYNLPFEWNFPPILILAAIAVPLDLPHRNVFFSYNFEANYNLPYTWDIPPYANGIEDEDFELRKLQDCANCTETETTTDDSTTETATTTTTTKRTTTKSSSKSKSRERRSLLTRTHFYQILAHKFERSGFQGEPCLLRLICETNASSLGDINGVLGSLIHVLFSPTTSMNENLPLQYYQAEVDGTRDQCEHYAGECATNVIDFMSQPLHEIINTLTANK